MLSNNHIINRVIQYWRLCIESEDRLMQHLSPRAGLKSALSEFGNDPFIFPPHNQSPVACVQEGNVGTLLSRISVSGKELFYGYPIVYFKENDKEHIAPLLLMRLSITKDEDGTRYIIPDESSIETGIIATKKLGFRSEEITSYAEAIKEIILGSSLDEQSRLNAVLEIFSSQTTLPVIEPIHPAQILTRTTFGRHAEPGLYNSAVFFEGENTLFNDALLKELLTLEKTANLSQTALSSVITQSNPKNKTDRTISPILGFHADEYQISAIRQAMRNNLTVITGPPGTGKSQLIINLLLTLSIHGKTALLVSHTNEAINVVYEKILDTFGFLLIRTGSKPHRQKLKHAFLTYQSQISSYSTNYSEISLQLESIWVKIETYQKQLLEIDTLSQRFEQKYNEYQRNVSYFTNSNLIDHSLHLLRNKKNLLEQEVAAIDHLMSAVKTRTAKRRSIFNMFCIFFLRKKINKHINTMLDCLPEAFLQQRKVIDCIAHNKIGPLVRFVKRLLPTLTLYCDYKDIGDELQLYRDVQWIEKEIIYLLEEYRQLSKQFITLYTAARFNTNQHQTGKVLSLLQKISEPPRNSISAEFFSSTTQLLPLWACTLKSLKTSFPLEAGLFDYIIFDEASQIDLPSAAPALYRGKQAIVVGDPMQLSHITTLSDHMEKALAQQANLFNVQSIYPDRVGYKKLNLFKASEAALTTHPIFLANHYRSHQEIISLCNTIFYKDDIKVLSRLDESKWPNALETGIHWKPCEGTSRRYKYGSRFNKEECDSVIVLLKSLITQLKGSEFSIGIVTPFSLQSEMLTNQVTQILDQKVIDHHAIKVQTVHKFQGSEKDIMIFSPVVSGRGDGNSDHWFNSYTQLLNVALSRARRLLYIVGDFDYFKSRNGILRIIAETYETITTQRTLGDNLAKGKIDTQYERTLYSHLIKSKHIKSLGYQVELKTPVGPYILDISLIGPKRVNIECDGAQHEIIDGIPVIKDINRDGYLREQGWEIIRVKNFRIAAHLDDVITEIERIAG